MIVGPCCSAVAAGSPLGASSVSVQQNQKGTSNHRSVKFHDEERNRHTSSMSNRPSLVNGLGKMSFIPVSGELIRRLLCYGINETLTRRVVTHDLRWFRVARHRDDRGHMIELPDHRGCRNTVKLGHDNVLRMTQISSTSETSRTGLTHHENQVVFLQVHLVHGSNTIHSDVDGAPEDLQELAREFPADRVVLD